jgi:NADH dehydrogenase
VRVIQGEVTRVDLKAQRIFGDFGEAAYDALVLACGAQHSYFGHEEWEVHAPGLKTLEQATEIRRRVLVAYELAEREPNEKKRRELLTFVIVGGGPTGVELAGAIGEMSRFTLGQDFRNIDPALTRIILIEAGKRILPSFAEHLSSRATRDLEKLGVQVWTNAAVTNVDAEGVDVGEERIQARTVLWAAGVRASDVGKTLGVPLDRQQRVVVGPDLAIPGHSEVFVLGDQAHYEQTAGTPLPGVAPVATQQGRFIGSVIRADVMGRPRPSFRYTDKGQMATIGRRRAVVQAGGFWLAGFTAWLAWMFVHIYYLTGFKNRIFVLLQWAWSYFTFRRGARLIVDKSWRSYPRSGKSTAAAEATTSGVADPNLATLIPGEQPPLPAVHTATGTYPSVRAAGPR